MKILIFTETYLPTVNGVVDSIELFRHELIKRGHQVDIVAPTSKSEHFKKRAHVFRLLSLPWIGQPTHPVAWPYSSQVQSIISEVKPDLVHVQGMFSCGWLGKKTALKNKLPLLLTYHTNLGEYAHYAGIFAWLAKPALAVWTRIFTRGFDLVITPTPSIARLLKHGGIKNDIVALPTGIETKNYYPFDRSRLRRELGLSADKTYLLFVGRLASEKNVAQLLVDFGRLHVHCPNVQLLIIGDGPDHHAYQTIVNARGLSEYVKFFGALPHDQLIKYYQASDLFCFPSLTDTQGIVLVEAMSTGLPSVAYDRYGPGDLIKDGENGLLSKVGTDQFFQNMLRMIEDKSLRDKLSVGALRESRKYSIEKTTDQLEQLYKVLIESKLDHKDES